MNKPHTPHTTDITVGGNIKALRKSAGMSQTFVGEKLGITFQQMQKYEKGTNRISASRVVDLCNVLGCTLDDVFAGTALNGNKSLVLPQGDALVLAGKIANITNPKKFRALRAMVNVMAEA